MTDLAAGRTRRILIIDDDSLTVAALEPYFAEQKLQTRSATTGADGLNDALANPPSLILLAVNLPDSPGIDIFRKLRSRARTAQIPVMFLAGHTEMRHQKELLSAGADDFITKPFDLDILGLRVRNAIKRSERDGVNHPKTGLPTGRLLQERVRALADETGWYKIDFVIEGFEAFRDLYGFMSGEEVVAFAARLVNDAVQQDGTPDDFIGHRADNEFVIITLLANGPKLREVLEKRFNDEVLSFYTFIERDQGFISAGDGTQKPLMSARIRVQEGEAAED